MTRFLKTTTTTMLTSAIYGGNSGGPVISKDPDGIVRYWCHVAAVEHTVAGVLYGYRNGKYEERMYLYEHANLGVVVPMEYVKAS